MPDCDLNGWVHFLPDGEHEVSLHDFEEIEVIPNCTVQILKCKKCGKLSIGWYRGEVEEE